MEELTSDELRAGILDGLESFGMRLDALSPGDWDRRTRCPGWRVRDLAWHVAWGEGPGEVIRAAMRGDDPPEYATSRMGGTPSNDEIVASMHAKLEMVHRDLGALSSDDANMTVRYGRDDPGRSLGEYLWHVLVEVAVHGDDLVCALEVDEEMDPRIAGQVVKRRVRGAVGWASKDGLQPVAPRGYRLTGKDVDCGFFFIDGWHEGIDESVPTCTFTADNTTLARLVMGRIPVSPFEASGSRPWDERLKLSGDIRVATPSDFMRWCYGAW